MNQHENEPSVGQRNLAHGSTTLKQCGWCVYASGTHRYSYCISGKCSLDKSYSKEVTWSDSCKFENASKSDIDAIINNHSYQMDSARTSIIRHKEYIKILGRIKRKAVQRPPLPDDRKSNHFEADAPLMIWIENRWIPGVVQYGYRHHDGCVSYKLQGLGPQDSGFWGAGMSIPTVLLTDEWEFFAANPDQYQEWCKKAYDKKFNGEILDVAPIKI